MLAGVYAHQYCALTPPVLHPSLVTIMCLEVLAHSIAIALSSRACARLLCKTPFACELVWAVFSRAAELLAVERTFRPNQKYAGGHACLFEWLDSRKYAASIVCIEYMNRKEAKECRLRGKVGGCFGRWRAPSPPDPLEVNGYEARDRLPVWYSYIITVEPQSGSGTI